MQTNVIDRTRLQTIAPSVFAKTPYVAMSARYKFLPTIEVIDLLADRGFLPVQAAQSRARLAGKSDFTKHMIRLRHRDALGQIAVVGEEVAELVLTNSHDGTSAVRFDAGVFRFVCGNGMVVKSRDDGGFKVRHMGGTGWEQQVIDATFSVVENAQVGVKTMGEWRAIDLAPPERNAFALAALEVRPINSAEPKHMLATRRYADQRSDLATTFNVIQENAIKGTVSKVYNRETGSARRAKGITSVGEDLRINRALWVLASEMAKLKS